jgi:hypothetical protein
MITIKNKEKIKGTKFLVHSNEFTIIEMDEADNYTYKITVKYYERVTYQTGNITTPGLREVFTFLKLNRIIDNSYGTYLKLNRIIDNSYGTYILTYDEMDGMVSLNLSQIKSLKSFILAIRTLIVNNF